MSVRSDSTGLISGAVLSSLYAGFGILGVNVASTGTSGPSALYQCLSLPADNAIEFMGQITRLPTGGTFDIDEGLTFTYIGPSDYFEYRLFADGVASIDNAQGWGAGIVRVWLYTGISGTFTGNLLQDDFLPGGTFTSVVPSVISAGIQAADDVPSGTFTTSQASLISHGIQAADDRPGGLFYCGQLPTRVGTARFSMSTTVVRVSRGEG